MTQIIMFFNNLTVRFLCDYLKSNFVNKAQYFIRSPALAQVWAVWSINHMRLET